MSIYSNVTEQDLINLRKLAEQQKEQRAPNIKNKILKQTHDIKLAESLSPITNKSDETSKKLGDVIQKSTQNLGNVIKENNTPELAIENTPTIQPIEKKEGVMYDIDLENTLKNIDKNNIGFLKTYRDPQRGWMLNNHPIKMLGGTKLKVYDKKNNITPGIQKVFTDTSYNTAKSMSDTEKLVFRDILQNTDYNNCIPRKSRMSGRDKNIKNILDNDVRRILKLDTKLRGKGIERIIIPSNVIDIYTRL